MGRLSDLLGVIGTRRPVFVLTHDFPDHDAVASAFGVQGVLSLAGVTSRIVYGGDLQRDSLRRMIRDLGIDVLSTGPW